TADVATRTRTPAVTVVAPNFLRSHSYLFFLYPSHYHRDLHSFPTRRSSDLVRYMAEARDLRLAPDVAREAKHRILDTLAAMVSGSHLQAGEMAIRFARAQGGVAEATVLTTDIRTSAVNAALANGMFAHADETDD